MEDERLKTHCYRITSLSLKTPFFRINKRQRNDNLRCQKENFYFLGFLKLSGCERVELIGNNVNVIKAKGGSGDKLIVDKLCRFQICKIPIGIADLAVFKYFRNKH